MKKKDTPKFIIVSLRQGVGGGIALHKLCSLLSQRGYDARIFLYKGAGVDYNNMFKFWLQYWVWTFYDFFMIFQSFVFKGAFISKRKYEYYVNPSVKGCKRKIMPFYDRDNTIVVYPEIVQGNFLKAKNVIRWLLNKNYHIKSSNDNNDLIND